MFNNYQKMRDMEAVIASALPEGTLDGWSDALTVGRGDGEQYIEGEVEVERVPGGVYPEETGEIVIETAEEFQTGADFSAAESEPAGASPSREINGTLGTEAATLAAKEQMDVREETAARIEAAARTETAGAGQTAGAEPQESASQPAKPVQIPSDAVLHVVENGETLYSICMENYHSMKQIEDICQWNGLEDENRLSIGQEIYIPATEASE